MIASQLINDSILPMPKNATPIEIMSWMEEYKVMHLPIVDGNKYYGLLSEADIFSCKEPEASIMKSKNLLKNIFVQEQQHIYEVIGLMSSEQLSVLPVLDHNEHYKGVITPCAIVKNMATLAAVNQPGAVLILEMNEHEYLASQIVQIIESADARLLSLYVSSEPESTKIDVSIKVNVVEISALLQSFDRFGYTVKASFYENADDDLSDRYNSLMNYLSI